VLWTCSEVQPNEAGALAAVVQALIKGDAASRQERFRWIVTEGERAAVQPGEIEGRVAARIEEDRWTRSTGSRWDS
jgi:hypothetical protein